MEYILYQYRFPAGVHFGNGRIEGTDHTFQADTFYAAIYQEALKINKEEELQTLVQTGKLVFSDAFPFIGDHYLIPKPMLHVMGTGENDTSIQKKRMKKLKYLPADSLDAFLEGDLNMEAIPHEGNPGTYSMRTIAAVRGLEDTLPYRLGTYLFYPDCGLYMLFGYEGNTDELLSVLLDALALSGIGGKRSSGLGRFTLQRKALPEAMKKLLERDEGWYMTLSVSLPDQDEMEEALKGASYLVERRGGFVASDHYADSFRRKRDLYAFSAGSVFYRRFRGNVYDVSAGGNHPVYRYARPLFMGI